MATTQGYPANQWDDPNNQYDYAHYGEPDQYNQNQNDMDNNMHMNNNYGHPNEEDEDINPDFWQESCWGIISAYFDERGLVRQQLDSFDEFVQIKVQRMVEETPAIELVGEQTHDDPQHDEEPLRYEVKFDQIYLSVPTHWETDGGLTKIAPYDARLRGLTYSAPLYVDVKKREIQPGRLPHEGAADFVIPPDDKKIFIGKIPIMLKSKYCKLYDMNDRDLYELQECPLDPGGYFVINGSEKVIIAQEQMATNEVFVFKKKDIKYVMTSECRSIDENASRKGSASVLINLHAKSAKSAGRSKNIGQKISAILPYIRQEIPIVIVFRALGFVSDRDILEHIVYDFDDNEIMEKVKPSLDEAFVIQGNETALNFIGSRGSKPGISKEKRIRYARDILQKELLPHIGISEFCETKKAYFVGYMVNRLLQVYLGRKEEDDRDHFGNKRLMLAGPLLAFLFKMLFTKLCKELRMEAQRHVDKKMDFKVSACIRNKTITDGLKYSLATGNWGEQQKVFDAKPGVSQVLNRLSYASTLSHLRRVNSPTGRDGKIAKPRQLHATTWGMICPAETPEGQAVGLVKNLSLIFVGVLGCFFMNSPIDLQIYFFRLYIELTFFKKTKFNF